MTDFPDTKNMRWLLAETKPEIGWPQQAFDALVDITKACELIESGLSSPPVGRWRPIETAPRDGSNMLLFNPSASKSLITYGRWSETSKTWNVAGNSLTCGKVTHWMPLPPPPGAEAPAVDVEKLKREVFVSLKEPMPVIEELKFRHWIGKLIDHLLSLGVIKERG